MVCRHGAQPKANPWLLETFLVLGSEALDLAEHPVGLGDRERLVDAYELVVGGNEWGRKKIQYG